VGVGLFYTQGVKAEGGKWIGKGKRLREEEEEA
jgi:hypothetical protein